MDKRRKVGVGLSRNIYNTRGGWCRELRIRVGSRIQRMVQDIAKVATQVALTTCTKSVMQVRSVDKI